MKEVPQWWKNILIYWVRNNIWHPHWFVNLLIKRKLIGQIDYEQQTTNT